MRNIEATAILSTGKARLAVKTLIEAEDTVAAVEAYLVEAANPDYLKIAEIALLARPIIAAVERFLESPTAGFSLGERRSLVEIANHVGMQIFEYVWDLLKQEPRLLGCADRIAIQRAAMMHEPNHAFLIAPFERALNGASLSSAHSTVNAIEAHIYAVESSVGTGLAHETLVAEVRASHQLPLANQQVQLEDMSIVSTILHAFNHSVPGGRGYPDPILRYDPDAHKVVLGKPLQAWNIGPTLTIDAVRSRHEDGRVGCPFSFAPKEIRVGYYEAIVDLVDAYGQWPTSVAR